IRASTSENAGFKTQQNRRLPKKRADNQARAARAVKEREENAAMKVKDSPSYDFVANGLRAVNSNDWGTLDPILKEWPAEVFITGRGLEDSPMSDPAKAVVIFTQLKRSNPNLFVNQAHALNLADAFCAAARTQQVCDDLSIGWWKGLEEDPDAPLRIKGELSILTAMPKPNPGWCGRYDLHVEKWGTKWVQGLLLPKKGGPKQPPASHRCPIRFKVDVQGTSKRNVTLFTANQEDPSEQGSGIGHALEVMPTAVLEVLRDGLEGFLAEKTADPVLAELRAEAEKSRGTNVGGSARQPFDAIKAILDHRAEVLAKAEELLAGPTAENVGERSRTNLSKLAENVVEDPDSQETA
ncbi:hypothetical protein ACFL6C_12500, partial [Myxococcota bacterium]